jgi:hypothetical protein
MERNRGTCTTAILVNPSKQITERLIRRTRSNSFRQEPRNRDWTPSSIPPATPCVTTSLVMYSLAHRHWFWQHGRLATDFEYPDILQQVTVNAIRNSDCGMSKGPGFMTYVDQITPAMLCTADQGEDSCHGDSGGSIILGEFVGIRYSS